MTKNKTALRLLVWWFNWKYVHIKSFRRKHEKEVNRTIRMLDELQGRQDNAKYLTP